MESVYEGALVIEFQRLGIPVGRQRAYPVYYKGELAGANIADMMVDGRIRLELKSVQMMTSMMEARFLNYLRLSGVPVGYLVNFRNQKVEWKPFVRGRE